MMGFGILVPILLLVAVAYMFGWLPQNRQQPPDRTQDQPTANESPLDILKKRYARGEISQTEYEEMRKELTR